MKYDRVKIGISKCLIGEAVRYDGGHKLSRDILDAAGDRVCWHPVCPEMECGLGVPREPMRLEGDPDAPRLVTVKTRVDLTDRMESWIAQKLFELAKEGLSVFIFKSRSPSCGIDYVPVYDEKTGEVLSLESGLFARAFSARFGDIPAIDSDTFHRCHPLFHALIP